MIYNEMNKNLGKEKKAKNKNSSKNVNKTGCDAYLGGNEMIKSEVNESLFTNVIGFRELRSRISEVIESVVTDYSVVISGNVKKSNSKTAAIISTNILDDILSIYRFNPIINLDEDTNQYEVILQEINIYGCSETKDDAKEMVVDMVIDATKDYFANADMYARIPDERAKYPYFLRIRSCMNRDDVKKALNLE